MLDLLETLCAVADTGSLSRAAERLHRTQPAVTRQVQALERQLGAVLVLRTPHGVELTPAGLAVLPHARATMTAVRALRETAATASGNSPSALRLAAGLMAMQYILPPVLARFHERFPDIEIDLQPAHQRVAVERLLRYEVDAAVIASPVRSAQVRAIPLIHDPLMAVRAAPAPPDPMTLHDFAGTALLVLAAGTGMYEQVDAALRERGVTCKLVEHPTAETIKTALSLGSAVSILPASAIRDEVQAGTLVARPITGWREARRTVRLLVRAEGRPPAAVTALLDLLRAQYGQPARGRAVAGLH